ncbi:hypothetical protein HMPREF9264_1298 [Lactobacillus delbrueckii subsp. bulgaricus PB2003/044-T3-4]|nr:hypothetical protein HMPREF9264_1298 [Lactobacillus delbrueckii subsp. bulgaricus PB2003/044-T3-4]
MLLSSRILLFKRKYISVNPEQSAQVIQFVLMALKFLAKIHL